MHNSDDRQPQTQPQVADANRLWMMFFFGMLSGAGFTVMVLAMLGF